MADQPSPSKKPWVKLHLAAQTQPSVIPEFIIGRLEQEAPTSYVLSSVIEEVETSDTFEVQARQGLDFINRTYVWRLEILDEAPDVDFLNTQQRGRYFASEDSGGLG